MNGGSSAQSDPLVGIASIMQAQAANRMADLGDRSLDFAKEQFGIANKRQDKLDVLNEQVTQKQMRAMDNANAWSEEDRARYKSVFLPMQDKYIEKANNWDSAAKQSEAAAEAKADVQSAIADQKAQSERAMAANGVRPDSGAWAGQDRALQLQGGMASAGAQNQARRDLRKEAMALQGDVLNIGNGLPSQAAQGLNSGVNAGNSMMSNNIANQNSWRANIPIMQTGFEQAMTGWNNSGNMWRNIGKDRTDMLNTSDKMRQDSMGSLLGGAGKLFGMLPGMAMSSSKDAKEDKREVRGVLDALKQMPVEAWDYKPGEGDGGSHIGTYAEDFQRATGLGDGKSINIIDALGVTMGAVKELAEKVDGDAKTEKHDEKPARKMAKKSSGKSIFKEAA